MTTLIGESFPALGTAAPSQREDVKRSAYCPLACSLGLLAADLLGIAAAEMLGALFGKNALPGFGLLADPTGWPDGSHGLLFAGFVVAYLASHRRYHGRAPFWDEIRVVVCACLTLAGLELLLCVFSRDRATCASAMAALLVLPFLTAAANWAAKRRLARSGRWWRPYLVVGCPANAAAAELALAADPGFGCRVQARIDPADLAAGAANWRLAAALRQHGATHLLIAVDADLQRRVVECALREQIPFDVAAPSWLPPFHAWEPQRSIAQDTVILSSRAGLSAPAAKVRKAVLDIVLATLILVAVSPLLIALGILSRLDGGPALFAHPRIGVNGARFNCLKFRTMVVDADRVLDDILARDPVLAAEWAATRKLANDPRVTRLGRLLRRTSLDELPQLLNVLRLEMSLVGPRPIVESEAEFYGEDIAHYHATRPGLTGLWQVSGRSNTSYARRVQLDVWYVTNWTLWTDIILLLKTLPVVLSRNGAC